MGALILFILLIATPALTFFIALPSSYKIRHRLFGWHYIAAKIDNTWVISKVLRAGDEMYVHIGAYDYDITPYGEIHPPRPRWHKNVRLTYSPLTFELKEKPNDA